MPIEEYHGTTGEMLKVLRADAENLGAEDLPEDGKPICVLIDKVLRLTGDGELAIAGRKLKQGEVIYAVTMLSRTGEVLKKRLLCRKTKIKVIESLYGKKVAEWHGKPLWLVRGETTLKGKPVACVTIQARSDMPQTGKAKQQPPVAKTEETQPELSAWERYEACLAAAADERQVEAVYDAAFGPESSEQWTDQQRQDAVAAKEARKTGIQRKKGGA